MISASEPLKSYNSEGVLVMQVNTTFRNGAKIVSLCCDNSVGRMGHELKRSDIRCIVEGKDITSDVFGVGEYAVVAANMKTMQQAMNWLNRVSWGFDR